jgi:putative ABC transport system substrate-binding protein
MEGSPTTLFIGSSGWFEDVHAHVVEFALKTRLPTLFVRREYAEAGGFMSYGVSYPSMYSLATDYIVRVLNGASTATLPVQQPVVVELVINLRTARAIGVEMPPLLLTRADAVIE